MLAETALEGECLRNPTKQWGRHESAGKPFAVAFSGGMRNFVTIWFSWQKHVVEASGGNVHLYFHVWRDENSGSRSPMSVRGRELAMSLPQTKRFVEEDFRDHGKLLFHDEPSHSDGGTTNGTILSLGRSGGRDKSWLEYASEPTPGRPPPFVLGATFSQFRKVYLAMQLVKQSSIDYGLVMRARPDHIFLQPFDLRDFARDHAARSQVQKANGHFLAIAERAPQVT